MRRVFSAIMFILLLTSMLTLAFNIQPARGEPRTWTVDDDGPADFHMIQEAINAASDDDTVFVHDGTYFETVCVNRSLSLVGENRVDTIIDGNATWDAYLGLWAEPTLRLETGTSSNVTGFTIRNGGYGVQAVTLWFSPVFTGHRIEGNLIVSNRAGGILLKGCANNTVSNNLIANNTLVGIHLWNAGNNTIADNTVENNGYGLDFYGNSDDNLLRNNNMTDNQYNFGPVLRGDTWNWLAGPPLKPGLCNDVDSSNTVNGKPIYCWVNRRNEQVPSDAGYVWLNNCTDISIKGLSLSGNLQGILLQSTNNTSVSNCTITNNADGIWLWKANNNTIIGNTLKDNLNGVYLGDFSRFTTMRNNSINGGQRNFGIPPYNVRLSPYMDPLGPFAEFINDIDVSNTVDGKPIVYWMNQCDQKVPTNAGCVILINCTNILVQDLNISNNAQGLLAIASNNTIVANNSISGVVYGIDVKDVSYLTDQSTNVNYTYINYASSGTTIHGNILNDNGVGIRISGINSTSTITKNTLLRNPLGIYLRWKTTGNIISNNVVNESDISLRPQPSPGDPWLGVLYPETIWERSNELHMLLIGGIIVGGDYNLIYSNTVARDYVGIYTGDPLAGRGSGNLVFHNNFINNTLVQAWTGGGLNLWFVDYPSGGNYWSDYNGTDLFSGPYQNETGSDRIGDTPYVIDTINIDLCPLMQPYVPVLGDLNHDGKVDILDIVRAALSFGSYLGHPRWNFEADLNNDNKINILDVIISASNFGKYY